MMCVPLLGRMQPGGLCSSLRPPFIRCKRSCKTVLSEGCSSQIICKQLSRMGSPLKEAQEQKQILIVNMWKK